MEGLRLLKSLNLSDVAVETDSVFVDAVMNLECGFARKFQTVVQNCKYSITGTNINITVRHVYREANRVVDLLAKRGCNKALDEAWTMNPDPELGLHLYMDSLYCEIPRHL
ncbi:hypothetical protein FRX31_009209 [Thalictrum thalictroides]|uniref:RNase H type-1 domain-containing protein n=1 Tax=Thalictrum thalictroides TaxID=46969 RepID=A0A7J6WUV8_THATH|nr:hypothetical protein FRX31_009209 [Thalictrum thalictroides]